MRDFTASVVSACRFATSKVNLSDLHSDLLGLHHVLKYKQMLRELWHRTRNPGCETAINWTEKSDERWETKIGNSEATLQGHMTHCEIPS